MKIQFERKEAHDGSPFFSTKLKNSDEKKQNIFRVFAEKIRPTDQRKALLEARDTELVTAGGVEAGPRGGGGEGSRSRRLDYTRREGSPSGIMSSSSTAVCRLDPRARRVRFLRGAPRAHNASYCGIRGPRRNGSGWRQRRLGPA